MATIETAIEIACSPEQVFDVVSDLRSESQWNPGVEHIDKLDDRPIGVGTRYRAKWKRAPEVLVECIDYDRPRSWTNVNGGPLEIRSTFTVTPSPSGSVLSNTFDVRAHGAAKLFLSILVRRMRHQFQRNMTELKHVLETTTDRVEGV
jgi:uncharacterized protein YndB with AHSA1/START domain